MGKVWQRYGDYRARKRSVTANTLYDDVQLHLRNEIPIASRRWHRRADAGALRPMVQRAIREANEAEHGEMLSGARAWHWLMALVLQAPQAAIAQAEMDRYPHGFAARGERLNELIDFNDAFVSTVLSLDAALLPGFAEEAKRLMDWLCKRVGVRGFSEEQYGAIVQGLGREIAVYRGVQAEGLQVHMTSRAHDAMGIDMVISDPTTGTSVNIDCKAPSSYRHRVYDLRREGRLSDAEVAAAEELGYIGEMNGQGRDKVPVVLWKIDRERYGDIAAFAFPDTKPLGQTIQAILRVYGN